MEEAKITRIKNAWNGAIINEALKRWSSNKKTSNFKSHPLTISWGVCLALETPRCLKIKRLSLYNMSYKV
jgi:hypothetical protein